MKIGGKYPPFDRTLPGKKNAGKEMPQLVTVSIFFAQFATGTIPLPEGAAWCLFQIVGTEKPIRH